MSHDNGSMPRGIQFVNETESIIAESNGELLYSAGMKRSLDDSDSDDSGVQNHHILQNAASVGLPPGMNPKPGKKTKGRVKIKMEFIENKLRRYTTFSKRKTGIMKKAYELSTLTGTQVMLLVASETGHVYTFATRKLQPMITSDSGKALIQTCLNSPDGSAPVGASPTNDDQRMNPTGFEEPELSYGPVSEDDLPSTVKGGMPYAPQPATPEPNAMLIQHSPAAPTAQPAHSKPPTPNYSQQQTPSSNNKAQNVSMQLPTGSIILPQSAIQPGTPIAFSPAAFAQQQSGVAPTQQAIYRIPTPAPGQVVSLPGFPPQSAANNSAITSAAVTSSPASYLQQPIAMVSGTQTTASAPQTPGGFMYQTQQGMVYAPSPGTLPEGYNFILPQNAINNSRDQNGMPQQFITIPVSSLSSSNPQMIPMQSDLLNATDLSKPRGDIK